MAAVRARHSGATNIAPGGGQTPASGGRRISVGLNGGKVGGEKYLWILVALEVGAMVALRHFFRRYHGG